MAAMTLGFSSSAKASSQELSGYIYSESSGWISLNCSNANSCSTIDYKVLKDDMGVLSGYGYSENGGWVNFNPNFGGVKIDSANNLSGWVFTENSGWLDVDGAKIISVNDLKNDILSASEKASSGNLSSDGAASLLDSLCNDFLPASECNMAGTQD